MKMTVYVTTGKQGARVAETFDVPDEAVRREDGSLDDEKAEEVAREAMFNLIEWGWWEGSDRAKRRD